jgi:hypothetical protein
MREELSAILGPIDDIAPVARGYTNNERAIVRFRDGSSVFAKHAVDDLTADWLRTERRMYETLASLDCVPRLVAWIEGERPLLVIEDLSDATWPPPWDRAQVDAVVSSLGQLAGFQLPDGLQLLEDGEKPDDGWQRIMSDPREFLSLGLCDRGWLERNGPVLASASAAAPLAGPSLLHGDVRSDNLCFRDGSALLIDWNGVCIGNPVFDVAFFLPSLESEGGPAPEEVLPDCPPELVAFVSGFFASRAGQPLLPHAPLVRQVQASQLKTALPWAARSLGIAEPVPPRSGD